MRYITLERAREIHRLTIDYSDGGAYEHFDLGRLDSVLENIQNDDYYPTLADKLTHLFFCTCKFHCFADGNKRLAVTLCVELLLCNGYRRAAEVFFPAMEYVTYQVAAGTIDKELLHRILSAFLEGRTDRALQEDILKAIR